MVKSTKVDLHCVTGNEQATEINALGPRPRVQETLSYVVHLSRPLQTR